MKEFYYFLFF